MAELLASPATGLHPARPTTEADNSEHHGSHTHLISRPEVRNDQGAGVDAIIVPTARPVERLRDALGAAASLGCPLLALCSKRSNARKTSALGQELGADVVAVDITADVPRPPFETTRLLAGTRFQTGTDTSIKRNLGLLIARMVGWERVVFLDDDITGTRADDLRRASHLLGTYRAVGLANAGYPDNSVVCHAHRATGGAQDTFVGAGALAIAASEIAAFFPDVYNEDWLFLLDAVQGGFVTTMGQVAQDAYDPFASPRRARAEEFGDCLAEGLFWLLDQTYELAWASKEHYWVIFTGKRRRFIADLIEKVATSNMAPVLREQMIRALKAAQESQVRFRPKFYADYVAALHHDRAIWLEHLTRPAAVSTVDKALAELGLLYHRPGRTDDDPTMLAPGKPVPRALGPKNASSIQKLERPRSQERRSGPTTPRKRQSRRTVPAPRQTRRSVKSGPWPRIGRRLTRVMLWSITFLLPTALIATTTRRLRTYYGTVTHGPNRAIRPWLGTRRGARADEFLAVAVPVEPDRCSAGRSDDALSLL